MPRLRVDELSVGAIGSVEAAGQDRKQAAIGAQPVGAPARAQLWALYFFTAEFGLVQHEGQPRLYGAGLLSSAGEIHHCVNELTPRPAFDLATVLHTPATGTRYQNQYFVLPAWEQLTDSVAELTGLLAMA